MIRLTVTAWTDALRFHHLDDEARDVPRIAEGFRVLAATCHAWPAPIDLVRAMPPANQRQYFHALPKPELTPEQAEAYRQHARRVIAEAAKTLGFDHE